MAQVSPKIVLRRTVRHREEILRSNVGTCLHCRRSYPPAAITRWIDWDTTRDEDPDSNKGQTAVCPLSGVDAVVGSAAGFDLTPDLLDRIDRSYFG